MSLTTLERSIIGSGTSSCPESYGSSIQEGGSDSTAKNLRLAFLGCEALPPYGPCEHTAKLFMDLIAVAWSLALAPRQQRTLILDVFAASEGELPSEDNLSGFDGVILPGSFSSAYETNAPWILNLGDWIQTLLVKKEVPALGVCFGHQLYAHSFRGESGGGIATKCPAGPQAGRKITRLTPSGRAFLDVAQNSQGGEELASIFQSKGCHNSNNNCRDDVKNSLELFYTHGDMVESLPPSGISLGGNETVPVQSAVYFSSPPSPGDDPAAWIRTNGRSGNGGDTDYQRVIAVTFQAHPEFASLGGKIKNAKGEETFFNTVRLMRDNGDLSKEDCEEALSDAEKCCNHVNHHSLEAIIGAGRLLGWFK